MHDHDLKAPPTSFPYRRVVVIGTTGSGKTTMARMLARRLGVPHVEMDALHWDANWTPAQTETFRERVAAALSGEVWVVDGNYSKTRDIVWPRAQAVVWLDYPLSLVLRRLARRTLRRVATREHLWNGNYERVSNAIFTRDNLFAWALKTHGRHRRQYPSLLAAPEHAHLMLIRLRLPRMAQRWLDRLAVVPARPAG